MSSSAVNCHMLMRGIPCQVGFESGVIHIDPCPAQPRYALALQTV